MIPNYPGFYGPGWSEKCATWAKENIPAEYLDDVNSEAMIAWNMQGGSPSSIWASKIRRFIAQFNAGQEPDFPSVKWNQNFLERQKLSRMNGDFSP